MSRIRLDDLTDEQLDSLYDRVAELEAETAKLVRWHREDGTTLAKAEARASKLAEQLADASEELAEVREHNDRACEAVARAEKAEAALERVLSRAGIRAAAEAIGDEALTRLGRNLGTIHVERIAEAGLRAALDEQPTT